MTEPHPLDLPVLVAVAHGSRDPRALATVRALLARVAARRPGLDIRLGHIELNEPLLDDTLAAVRGEAVLVPLLLGRGHHVKSDLPSALTRAPHLRATIAPPLGPHPLLAEALHSRLREAGWHPPPPPPDPGATTRAAASPRAAGPTGRIGAPGPDGDAAPGDLRRAARGTGMAYGSLSVGGPAPRLPWAGLAFPGRTGETQTRRGDDRVLSAVVLAAAGSRDVESAVDTRRTAALLSRRLGGIPVVPGYASAAAPTVGDAFRGLVAAGHRAELIAVASYFTAPGRFAAQCAAVAPAGAAAPLGAHHAMAELILRRYDQAAAALRYPAALAV